MAYVAEHLAAFGYIPDLFSPIDYGKLKSKFSGSLKVHHAGVVAPGVNMLPANLAPTNYQAARFRVYCVFSAAGVLVVQRTVAGVVIPEVLNEGVALVPGAAYMFDIAISGLETGINFQYSVPGLAMTFIVTEVLA